MRFSTSPSQLSYLRTPSIRGIRYALFPCNKLKIYSEMLPFMFIFVQYNGHSLFSFGSSRGNLL